MGKMFLIFVAAVCLSGCEPPGMLDMSQDRVLVMGNGASSPQVQAEAARGCGMYNRTPQFMSQTCADQYCIQKRYLFACTVPGAGTTNTPPRTSMATQ